MGKGEIIEENNRKVKGGKHRKVRKIEAVLLLCLTSILQPVWLGWPKQEYKTPASIAIWVIEVRNPPTTKM